MPCSMREMYVCSETVSFAFSAKKMGDQQYDH